MNYTELQLEQKRIQLLSQQCTQNKTEDQLQFILNFVKEYFPKDYQTLFNMFGKQNLSKAFQSAVVYELNKNKYLFKKKKDSQIDIYMLISGQIQLYQNQNEVTLFQDKETIIISTQNLYKYSALCKADSVMIKLDINSFRSNLQELQLQTDKKFSVIRNYYQNEKGKIMKKQQGFVLTTPTSGTNNLLYVLCGKVLIFCQNKCKEYEQNFIVLDIINQNEFFNEQFILFSNHEYKYGSLVIENDTQIINFEKNNYDTFLKEKFEDGIKSNFISRNQLLKQRINQIIQDKQNIQCNQNKLCDKFKVDLKEIKSFIDKNSKQGRIQISEDNIQQKLNLFDKIIKKQYPINQISQDDEQPNNIYGTCRLTSRRMQGMNFQQQKSMMKLQSMGKDLRQGISQKDDNLNEELVVHVKNKLLDIQNTQDQTYLNNKKLQTKNSLKLMKSFE